MSNNITCAGPRTDYYIYRTRQERAAAIKKFISKSDLKDIDAFTIETQDFDGTGKLQNYKDLKILKISQKNKEDSSVPLDYWKPYLTINTAKWPPEYEQRIYVGDRLDLMPYVTCGPNGGL